MDTNAARCRGKQLRFGSLNFKGPPFRHRHPTTIPTVLGGETGALTYAYSVFPFYHSQNSAYFVHFHDCSRIYLAATFL
jgi:hypothetical protein